MSNITEYSILEDVQDLLASKEQNPNGIKVDSFKTIASLWTAYLQAKGPSINLEPHDVATMMSLFKIARIANKVNIDDSFKDLIGYAALAYKHQKNSSNPATENKYGSVQN